MARGTRLAGQAFSVIRADWRLLTFPAAALVVDLLAIGAFLAIAASVSNRDVAIAVALLATAYPLTVSSTFFNVALMHVVSQRWHGNPAGIADGLSVARRRLGPILAWSLISATVGLALQLLQRIGHLALIERLLALTLGVAWGVVTFFVVPALALEDIGPLAALRCSSAVVRRRWAESLTGAVVIGGAASLALFPGIIVCMVGVLMFAAHPASATIVLLGGSAMALPVLLYLNATSAVFSLAVWEHADGGPPLGPFRPADLEHPFVGGAAMARARRWIADRVRRRQR